MDTHPKRALPGKVGAVFSAVSKVSLAKDALAIQNDLRKNLDNDFADFKAGFVGRLNGNVLTGPGNAAITQGRVFLGRPSAGSARTRIEVLRDG